MSLQNHRDTEFFDLLSLLGKDSILIVISETKMADGFSSTTSTILD